MNHRRLVGIDLDIASVHTVRVLDGEGTTIAKRKGMATLESLGGIEAGLTHRPRISGREYETPRDR